MSARPGWLALLLVLVLAACGQTGPLVLPGDATDDEQGDDADEQ